jgi:cullin-associated NEDD8-dissociated protein 1
VSRVLIPRLVGRVILPSHKQAELPRGLLELNPEKGFSSDAVDVMIEIVKCYGPLLQEMELVALAKAVMDIIESPQAGSVVKKRALAGVGAILVHFNDMQLSQFVSALIESFRAPHLTPNHRRFLISTIGTLARSTPSKFGPYLKTLAPFVLSAVSQDEMDDAVEDSDEEVDPEVEELRENALISLEALLGSCPKEMHVYMLEAVDAALRYLKYDPNVAFTDDEEMGGTQDNGSDDGVTEDAGDDDDDDDEYAELDEDDEFSDVDDVSWKARRCAAKALYTIIAGSSAADYEILFEKVAPVLISRLNNEREENVRLEVLSATSALVKKTGPTSRYLVSNHANGTANGDPVANSRKRRRQDSTGNRPEEAELHDLVRTRSSPPVIPASPPVGPQANLAALIPRIIQALVKMWKKASISVKQAAVMLMKNLTLTRNGTLSDHLQQIEDPIADALKPSTGPASASTTSSSTATMASLQIESLSLLCAIVETNPTSVLLPFVIALIPAVTNTVRDKNYKVSTEALGTLEQFVKALTPPRLLSSNKDHALHLEKLNSTILAKVTDNNSDLDVRHRAIQAFGVLLARTCATQLLTPSARAKGFQVLQDRLKNETTRLPSARAIGTLASAVTTRDGIETSWIRDVSLELAAQLRKADRSLRGSCLDALQNLALNPVTAEHYDDPTIQNLQAMLLPLISITDLHLLTPALIIFAKLIPANPRTIVNTQLVEGLQNVAKTRIEGPPLKAYLLLVKVIGEQKIGADLMKSLLGLGVAGDTMVVGRAIGTLLVYGGPNIGVTISDFLKEVDAATDVKAKCLALAVLGEVGFRLGPQSPLELDAFFTSLTSDSDKVRLAAAMALGSASASNVPKFLPIILGNLSVSPAQDYLYLYALKEVLQYSEHAAEDIKPYAQPLWQKLFDVSDAEDNRAVGAECIGRMALIDPIAYVPEMQRSLEDSKATVRGTVISAFRFTLADASSSYNTLLATTIIPMLKTMLSDSNIGNRRLAVTTLNAAIHNKPELIIPDLGQVLPIVLADSYIKQELIETVKIGPFQHLEDAGLDLRKSTYATMYELLDTPSAVSHMSIPAIFDRILDGIPDDNDIRTLCNLMIARLTVIDPDETRRRLSALAERFKVVLSQKIKENAVKQDIEKVNEANAAVIRTSLELDRNFPTAATDGSGEMVVWRGYQEMIKKDFAPVVRAIQSEA